MRDTSSLSCTSSLELLYLPQQREQFQKCPLSICNSCSGNSPKNRGVGRTVCISSWESKPHVGQGDKSCGGAEPPEFLYWQPSPHTEQPLPPRAHCEPPPLSWDKLLVLSTWSRGWEMAGDACCVHLQANTQPVIVAHKSIYSSPEKCGCAGGQCAEFLSIPLSLKAFSCAAHADWKACGQLCCMERRQSSRCLKKPLGYEDRQREICFLRLPTHLSTGALDCSGRLKYTA